MDGFCFVEIVHRCLRKHLAGKGVFVQTVATNIPQQDVKVSGNEGYAILQ